MNRCQRFSIGFMVVIVSLVAVAQEQGVAKSQLVMREIVQGMPRRSTSRDPSTQSTGRSISENPRRRLPPRRLSRKSV